RFLHGKLAIDGSIAVRDYDKVDLQARVTFDQLELAELFYDTAKRLGADGWASGWLDIHTSPSLVAELHVERLKLDLSSGYDRVPLPTQTRGPIVVRYEGAKNRALLVEPVRLASPTGELVVEGSASPEELAMHLRGELQLRLLEPYVSQWI